MTAEVPVLIVVVACLGVIVYAVGRARRGAGRGSAEPRPIPPDGRRRDETEARLESATNLWTKAVVMRRYEPNERGAAVFRREATILEARGYRTESQDAEGSHLHAGRLLPTGGLSVLAGRRGIRSRGMLTVTFVKPAARAGPSACGRRSARRGDSVAGEPDWA